MQERYEQLKKKFSLPEYADLDHEFEIWTVDEEQFLLRHIRMKIDSKLNMIIEIFEDILHPEGSFGGYREASMFSLDAREEMLDIYKKFMYHHRLATELLIEDSDKLNADYIKALMKEWPGMKKEALIFVKKLKESWTKDITQKEVVGYLG